MTQTLTHKPATRKRSLTVSFWLPLFAGAIDVGAITTSAMIAYYLRFWSPLSPLLPVAWQPKVSNYLLFGIVLGAVYVLVSWSYKNYASRIRIPLEREIGRIIRGSLLAMGLVLAGIFFYREFSYSRLVFLMTLVMMIPALTIARTIFQRVQISLFKKGVGVQRIAIWGSGESAQRIWRELEKSRSQGLELIGAIGNAPVAGGPSLGSAAQLKNLTFEHDLDMILMSPPPGEEHRMSEISHAAEGLPLELLYVPSAVEASPSRIQVTEVGGRPILKLKTLPMSGWRYIVKRAMDFGFSALFFLIFWPLFAIIALAVYLDSGRPIFYKQARVGMDGREFGMLKFRTMKVTAEADSGPVWAVRGDTRTTRVGKFLRRWSLDELPQFWLVLSGQMSLVGPRPERPHFVEEFSSYIPQYLDRHRVKAGLTGWAQVCGLRGSDSTIEERTVADLFYVENWNLWFDIRIILRTIAAVVSGKGAM